LVDGPRAVPKITDRAKVIRVDPRRDADRQALYQVGAGREAQDRVLEVQEPAGDPPGVFRGRGAPVGRAGRVPAEPVFLVLLEIKIRIEERFMLAEFPDDYPRYRQRVPG
jgi:hypothetical protein